MSQVANGVFEFFRPTPNQDPAGVRTLEKRSVRLTPDGKYYAFSFERVLSDLYLVEGLK